MSEQFLSANVCQRLSIAIAVDDSRDPLQTTFVSSNLIIFFEEVNWAVGTACVCRQLCRECRNHFSAATVGLDETDGVLLEMVICSSLEIRLGELVGKRQCLLKEVLCDDRLRIFISEPVVELLKYLFLPSGINYRNLLWHGFFIPSREENLLPLLLALFRTIFKEDPLKVLGFCENRAVVTNDIIPEKSMFRCLGRHRIDLFNAAWQLKNFAQPIETNAAVVILLPLLEQYLRVLFSVSNCCGDEEASVSKSPLAHEESYYTTLDGFGQRSKHQLLLFPILSEELRRPGSNDNLLPYWLGPSLYSRLVDYFMTQDGPNYRAMVCHTDLVAALNAGSKIVSLDECNCLFQLMVDLMNRFIVKEPVFVKDVHRLFHDVEIKDRSLLDYKATHHPFAILYGGIFSCLENSFALTISMIPRWFSLNVHSRESHSQVDTPRLSDAVQLAVSSYQELLAIEQERVQQIIGEILVVNNRAFDISFVHRSNLGKLVVDSSDSEALIGRITMPTSCALSVQCTESIANKLHLLQQKAAINSWDGIVLTIELFRLLLSSESTDQIISLVNESSHLEAALFGRLSLLRSEPVVREFGAAVKLCQVCGLIARNLADWMHSLEIRIIAGTAGSALRDKYARIVVDLSPVLVGFVQYCLSCVLSAVRSRNPVPCSLLTKLLNTAVSVSSGIPNGSVEARKGIDGALALLHQALGNKSFLKEFSLFLQQLH